MAAIGVYGQLVKRTLDDSVDAELLKVSLYDSANTYAVGNIVSLADGSGALSFWIAWSSSANTNPPARGSDPVSSGWELLSEQTAWRGDATVGLNYYHTGDIARLADGSIHICRVANGYTAGEIAAHADWTNLTAGGVETGDNFSVLAHDGTKVYIVGSIVSTVIGTGVPDYWICHNPARANLNPPTHGNEPDQIGWELLTEEAAWRGQAPVASIYYHAGDMVYLTDQTVRLCITARSYTAAEILVSPNWRTLANQLNVTTGLANPDDSDGAQGDWYFQSTDGTWFRKGVATWGTALYTPLTLALVVAATEVINGALGIPVASNNQRRLLYNPANDRLELSANRPHQSTDPTGTWVDPVTRTDLFVANDIFNDIPTAAANDFAYDTHYKHFYQLSLVYSGGGAGLEWVQTTPTLALAASRSVSTYSVRFLGERANDLDALRQIGTLSATTDYFYILGLELRRLTLSTYRAPGENIDHWIWESVAVTDAHIRDLSRVYSGLFWPRADLSNVYRLFYNLGARRLEICLNRPHTNGTVVGTWEFPTDRTDLEVRQSRFDEVAPDVNDYVFDIGAAHFYQYSIVFQGGTERNAWVQTLPENALAGSRSNNTYSIVFLGERESDADALSLITSLAANTDYFYVQNEAVRRLVLSSYQAPGQVTDHWGWYPTFDLEEAFGDLEVLTEQPAIADKVMVLDGSTDRLKSLDIENLGIYIKPNASGHLAPPTLEMIESRLVAIKDGHLLEPYRQLIGVHGASASWAEMSAERIETPWVGGISVAVGSLYAHDGWGWRCLVAHQTDSNDPPTGDDTNWERLSLLSTEVLPPIWTPGISYTLNERVRIESATGVVFWICKLAHLSTPQGDTGPPSDGTYWSSYALKTIDAGFRGVFTARADAPNPRTGDWAYFDIGGNAFSEQYQANDWYPWGPPSINSYIGRFQNADEALARIHFYTSSQTTAAIYSVAGRQYLFVLVAWTAPIAGSWVYRWQRADSDDILFSNWPSQDVPVEVIGALGADITDISDVITLTAVATKEVHRGDALRIGNEWIRVTGVSNQQHFTAVGYGAHAVSRGFRFTTAVSHDAGVAVSIDGYGPGRTLASRSWARGIGGTCQFDLGRVLGDGDRGSTLRLQVRCFNGSKWQTWPEIEMTADAFRRMEDHPISGTSVDNAVPFYVSDSTLEDLANWSEMVVWIARHRLTAADETAGIGQAGNDALIMAAGRNDPRNVLLFKVQAAIVLT